MDYELSRLNSRSFEQLIQVLASKVLGRGTVAFGDGPDGGRDATINGRVPYPSEADQWEGYIVLQAKFRQRPLGTTADGRWAYDQLEQELSRYRNRKTQAVDAPEYLIFATNVVLSPGAGGSKDRLSEMIEAARRELPSLRGFDIWDYDKLRMYLDQYEDVRRSFGPFVLPGDVLAEAVAAIEKISVAEPRFDDSIARFLQKELLAEQWANLDQAGTASEDQVPVSRVFVDLPVFPERRADPPEEIPGHLMRGLVSEVVEMSATRLDSSTEGDRARPSEGKLVVIGGPGQGKSTIGQFLCQMFRTALLRSRAHQAFAPEVQSALEMLEEHCRRDRLALPSACRFPLRVVLTEFADELANPEGHDSLLEYLAGRISRRIPGEVQPPLLSTWLAEYPWVLVLDGLDEVPPSGNREEVMAAIADFSIDMAESDADCLVIATTRPQGYANDFSPAHYRHLWLAPISPARALHYADRLLDVRFGADRDRRERISRRLERATESQDTARLMTSPLQVTIMTALLDRMGKPPPSRWSLFSQYYRVIYEREVEREIPAAQVLRDYKTDIDAIHQRVGLLLQVESGRTEQAEARMSRVQFAEIVTARLEEEGHDAEADPDLVGAVIEAAMNRLVLLVGLRADEVGFELRSLQEFMAAEALLDGREKVVEERLREVAPLPGWRNVFLFAAGRCFFDLSHLRDTVHTVCVELNDPGNEPLAPIVMPGAILAIDLIVDGIAFTQPRYQRLLAREALRLARRPPGTDHDRLAEIYTPPLRATYEEELQTALASRPFAATLGAWRTLTVLVARGVEWPQYVLREHFPEPEQLGELLAALPESARSHWLSAQLASRCAAAPPSQSLWNVAELKQLNVLTFTPKWLLALLQPEPAQPALMPVPWEAAGLRLGILTVKPRELHPDALDMGIQAQAHPAWGAHLAALRFSVSPSAASLTQALEELLRVADPGLMSDAAKVAPWPLAALMHAAPDRAALEHLTERAHTGAFGDRDQWLVAEDRWRKGIGAEDFDLELDKRLPYDATIERRGFPLTAAWTLGEGESRSKVPARAIFEALSKTRHTPARRGALVLLLASLGLRTNEGGPRAAVDARKLAAALAPGDAEEVGVIHFGALDKLHWSRPLDEGQLALLDEIGRNGDLLADSKEFPRPWFARMVADTWIEQPERAGLCRILASSPHLAAVQEWGERVLAVSPAGEARAPHALLQLRLTPAARWGEVPLDSIVSDALLFGEFIDVLADSGVDEPTLRMVLKLDELVPRRQWWLRQRLDALANLLIDRRPSRLATEDVWRALDLFQLSPARGTVRREGGGPRS